MTLTSTAASSVPPEDGALAVGEFPASLAGGGGRKSARPPFRLEAHEYAGAALLAVLDLYISRSGANQEGATVRQPLLPRSPQCDEGINRMGILYGSPSPHYEDISKARR